MSAPQTSIKPSDIDATSRPLRGAFGDSETEVSAGWIVRFCQQRDQGWASFLLSELQEFYGQENDGVFGFNRLVPHYVKVKDGIVTLTVEFIACCYAASVR